MSSPATAVDLGEADAIVAAHVRMREQLATSSASEETEPGLLVTLSKINNASCNGAYIHGPVTRDGTERALASLRAHGRPFQVSVRSVLLKSCRDQLEQAGLSVVADLPLMAVTPDRFRPAPAPPELRIRIMAPDEEGSHLPLVAQGLEMPLDALEHVMCAANRAAPCWTSYVGEVEGALAVTGTAIASPAAAGLISIVTDPRFERRGFGGALTSAAVARAFCENVPRVFLHASAAGEGLYRRLGFETLESLVVFGQTPH